MAEKKNPNLIRLLHVDDDESYLFLLNQFLNKISPRTYDIKSFNSSTEAFFEIYSNPETIDIIISDFEMPQYNGLTLFHKVSELNINIPFILLTGSKDEDLPRNALNTGIKFFLRKEDDIASLFKQLDQIIKVTVKQIRIEKDVESEIFMLTDFVSLITRSYENVDYEIYSQLLFKRILESILRISESEYGFMVEVQSVNDQEYTLANHYLTSTGWNSVIGYTFEVFEKQNFPFNSVQRLIESILIECNPIIKNKIQEEEFDFVDKGNTRKLKIKSFLAIPILFLSKLVGIVGLINKQDDYSESDVFKLHTFCLTLANYLFLKIYISGLNEKLPANRQT